MSESTGKRKKRYVDHPKDISKQTFLIHGPGNSSDEFKVLGDFGSKYYKTRTTKERGNDPANRNKCNRHQENNDIGNNEVDDIILQENNKVSSE